MVLLFACEEPGVIQEGLLLHQATAPGLPGRRAEARSGGQTRLRERDLQLSYQAGNHCDQGELTTKEF